MRWSLFVTVCQIFVTESTLKIEMRNCSRLPPLAGMFMHLFLAEPPLEWQREGRGVPTWGVAAGSGPRVVPVVAGGAS